MLTGKASRVQLSAGVVSMTVLVKGILQQSNWRRMCWEKKKNILFQVQKTPKIDIWSGTWCFQNIENTDSLMDVK